MQELQGHLNVKLICKCVLCLDILGVPLLSKADADDKRSGCAGRQKINLLKTTNGTQLETFMSSTVHSRHILRKFPFMATDENFFTRQRSG